MRFALVATLRPKEAIVGFLQQIVGEVAVPFPYPRPTHLRFAPEFGRLAAQVSGLLRGDDGRAGWVISA